MSVELTYKNTGKKITLDSVNFDREITLSRLLVENFSSLIDKIALDRKITKRDLLKMMSWIEDYNPDKDKIVQYNDIRYLSGTSGYLVLTENNEIIHMEILCRS